MAIDFRIRDFFHPFLIGRLRREFERHPRLPAGEMRAWQENRLRQVIARAYDQVPHYRRVLDEAGLRPADIQTLDDLPRLPLLSKPQARAAGAALHARDQTGLHPVEYHTSGTSGTPFTLLHDKHSNALEFVYYWRHWGWADYRLGNAFAQLSTLFFLTRGPAARFAAWQPHLRRLMLSSHHISPAAAAAMARELERRGCLFLKGVASTAYHLALSMREAGVRPRPLRAVISTSEVLPPYQRAVIEEVFGCRVLDSYGHMERTVAVSQCAHGGRHVNSDYSILEFINPRSSADGATLLAEGVGTGLHNQVMPFIRYETGDTFELYREPRPCPCGRVFPLIKAVHGRQEDTVRTPDGRYLTSLFMLPEFVTGLHETQFVQEAADRLVILAVPGEAFDAAQEEKLRQFTQTLAGPSMTVRVRRCARADLTRPPPGGKLRTVIPLAARV
ncbi:MAG: phenylacetate--CoA ligase family protein [Verrucomicrobiaceae bacterium]|nr:phenylacetate--CoA ligase family protein [Verrucomicrobiaceae bacterium]